MKLIEGMEWIFTRYNALLDSLPVPTKAEDGLFYHVLTGISRTAIKNYSLLREALDADDQEHLAWASRNLLELNVFMKCVLPSKTKLEEFASYRFIDGIEIVERLILLEKKYEREQNLTPNPNSQLAAHRTEFNHRMNAEGATRKTHLITREWAKTAGMIEEYDIINKVCSKLVHPTVWSILTEDIGSGRFPDADELFYFYGSTYFSEMFNLLNEHVKKYGPAPKP